MNVSTVFRDWNNYSIDRLYAYNQMICGKILMYIMRKCEIYKTLFAHDIYFQIFNYFMRNFEYEFKAAEIANTQHTAAKTKKYMILHYCILLYSILNMKFI